MKSLWLTVALIALAFAYADADPTCGATIAGTVQLTGDMHCEAVEKHGLIIGANATVLDCAGHTIYGPDRNEANGTPTGHYGIRADSKDQVTIKNCNVTDYERGFYLKNTSRSTVKNSRFYGNTRYGGNIAGGSNSWDNLVDTVEFDGNGAEGLHFGGPFAYDAAMHPGHRVVNSVADMNQAEGFYLLKANNVQLLDSSASGNGAAAVYVKASRAVVVSGLDVNGYVHLYDNSDRGSYSWVTITGGRLKVQRGNDNVPSGNTFDHVCVHNPRAAAFYFEGVALGDNVFTNSAAFDSPTAVTAISATSGNVMHNLYASGRLEIDATSSFTELTTQFTTPPICY